MNRQEMTRLGGIGLKFTPNPRDVRIHCSGLRVEVITPSGVQDSITSERTINIVKKVQQQVILSRSYFHGFAATGYLPAAYIDRHIGKTKYLVCHSSGFAGRNGASMAGKLVPDGRLPWITDFYYVIPMYRSFFCVVSSYSSLVARCVNLPSLRETSPIFPTRAMLSEQPSPSWQ